MSRHWAPICLFAVVVLNSGSLAAQGRQPTNYTFTTNNQSSPPKVSSKREDEPDREIARGIRQSIMLDKSLSTHAQNVKIISRNGMVTLKGSVRSLHEKRAIEAKAAEIVGEDGVLSQLEVQSKE